MCIDMLVNRDEVKMAHFDQVFRCVFFSVHTPKNTGPMSHCVDWTAGLVKDVLYDQKKHQKYFLARKNGQSHAAKIG